eukprot:TRINITY_DN26778_c0_g1_i5.p3 TRINITY_DN26778_c0_g1~~TRINITY_DN26778_c0_g1_i5.p3  ORF type:complete len:157 (+),score=13.36 TRINITY_DN26778_c0_g1_i5:554-1024(+)
MFRDFECKRSWGVKIQTLQNRLKKKKKKKILQNTTKPQNTQNRKNLPPKKINLLLFDNGLEQRNLRGSSRRLTGSRLATTPETAFNFRRQIYTPKKPLKMGVSPEVQSILLPNKLSYYNNDFFFCIFYSQSFRVVRSNCRLIHVIMCEQQFCQNAG